ncbi:unnamed protein product [Phytophthora lilii]|uniref:Unnamed protein product n=1 Tax=Phytophthora lilii TaxID=2077276 RepID=A0A9W6WUZ4_9STRA|nr:unnamed protein product [Phytophthora lilii]
MGTDAQCADSFAFFTSTPLVVQKPKAHRLLVVIPVRRECCSWQCGSSARVVYFTAHTSTIIEPARSGVDYVEARGTVLFEVGQQRAQLAVEILPALVDDWIEVGNSTHLYQRAFAVTLEAPSSTSTLLRASTEIIVEPTLLPKTATTSAASTVSVLRIVLGVLAAAGVVVLIACWFRVRRCRLSRRSRAFEYKVLLLPRRDSGASEEIREALISTSGRATRKSGIRRTARRVSSFTKWSAKDRPKHEATDRVVPEEAVSAVKTAADKREKEKGSSEDAEDDSEPERDLREHLASIQSSSAGQ